MDGADRQEAAVSIWALLPSGQVDAAARRVIEALRARGAAVTGPTQDMPVGPVDAVIVLLPPNGQQIAAAEELEARLAPWRDRLLPVVPGSRGSPVFADLSQLMLGSVSLPRAVERILLGARVGGTALADLYRLMGSVQQWEAAGRSESLLLRGSQVDDALLLLANTPASALASSAVPDYVAASAARRRRRNRRALMAAASAAAVLIAASVSALVQSGSARDATAASLQERRHSDSVRLAGLATEALELDPDLPWLLAEEALEAERSSQALTAARQVLARSPAHRVIRLPGPASGVEADPDSSTMALHYPGGRIEVRSATDGEVLMELPPTGGRQHLVGLSPGGQLLLVGGEDDRVVDAQDGSTVATLAPDQSFWGWADARRAVVSTAGAVGLLDVDTGSVAPTTATVAAEQLGRRAWSSRPGRGWTYLLDGETLIALHLATGQALPRIPVPGARDVAASPDGQEAFVTVETGPMQVFSRGPDGLTADDAAGFGERVSALADGWLLFDSAGQASVVRTGQAAPMLVFPAHRGPVTGAGPLPDGGFATVGGDHYLRLWTFDAQREVVPSADVQPFSADQGESTGHLESGRPLLAHDPGSDRITYTLQSPAVVGVVDARTLKRRGDDQYLGDITVLTRPLPGDRVAFVRDNGSTGVVDLAAAQLGWTRDLDVRFTTLTSLMGASPGGDRLAVASRANLVVWGKGDDGPVSVQFPVLETPVAVLLDDDNRASTVTVSGTWYREGQDTLVITSDGETVTAAAWGPDDVLYVLTGGGRLLAVKDGRTRVAAVLDGLDGFALRPSLEGDRIAVIGPQRSVVVSATTGAFLADLSPTGSDGSAVRDIAIDGDTLWTIRADGTVGRRDILDDSSVGNRLADLRPRTLTDGERDALAGATGFPGAT